jgi:hypothetical protein
MRNSTFAVIFVAVASSGALAQQPTTSKPTTVAAAPQPLRAVSLGMVPYPAKKQSTQQQSKDDSECFDWSKQSTGIDPAAPPPAPAQAANEGPSGARAKGAVRGAARGAVLGGVIDDKGGEGAAAGAMVGAARNQRHATAEKEAAQEKADADTRAAQSARLDTFKKGYAACMEGRGYSIK